jgi:energy-converting hydrogenase A subunit M
MTEYIYEKDLFGMKYRIITSPMHDRVIFGMAECLDMNIQDLRKYLIENLDMAFLENIPARYNSWRISDAKDSDSISSKLCFKLFSEYIPVLNETDIEEIRKTVKEDIDSGMPEDDAVKKGKEMIREIFLKWA